MALINCPECNKEISDKAKACPNCGYPVSELNIAISTLYKEEVSMPRLPADLSIGKQIVNWTSDAAIDGVYVNVDPSADNIPNGKVHVLLHKRGIRITTNFYIALKDIHFSQISTIYELTQNEIENKSVAGRAVAGAFLGGPVGAVVGGLSATGTKNITIYYLFIEYWDTDTNKQSLAIVGCRISSTRFIKRLEKEKINL